MSGLRTDNRDALIVETPDGTAISIPLAGPASRFLAWLLDELVVVGICGAAVQLFRLLAVLSTDLVTAVSILAYFFIWVGYGIALEWLWSGQTIGKRVLGLRVMDATGMRLQFSQIAVRNLMRFVDTLPVLYLVGGVAMLLGQHYQRIGDSVAGTVVLRQRRLTIPTLAHLEKGEKYNSLLEIPHLAARLRQQASPGLVQIAYEAILRRDHLAPATQIEVFRFLADRFRQLVKFPEELTAPLTDERYVRNVLGVLMTKESFACKEQI